MLNESILLTLIVVTNLAIVTEQLIYIFYLNIMKSSKKIQQLNKIRFQSP